MDARVPNGRRPRIPATGQAARCSDRSTTRCRRWGRIAALDARARASSRVERRRADEPQAAVVVLDRGRCAADRTERVRVQGVLDQVEQPGVVEHGGYLRGGSEGGPADRGLTPVSPPCPGSGRRFDAGRVSLGSRFGVGRAGRSAGEVLGPDVGRGRRPEERQRAARTPRAGSRGRARRRPGRRPRAPRGSACRRARRAPRARARSRCRGRVGRRRRPTPPPGRRRPRRPRRARRPRPGRDRAGGRRGC